MTDYIFKTPTIDEVPPTRVFPFNRFKLTNGISISKTDGVYSQSRFPNADDIATYDEFYQGGGTHTVTAAIRSALIAADIGIDSSNFTAI